MMGVLPRQELLHRGLINSSWITAMDGYDYVPVKRLHPFEIELNPRSHPQIADMLK
jgi:hypothetical protein